MFISKLSNSKSDVFNQCLWRAYLRYFLYIDEGVTPNERALKFGSFIHKIFEDGYEDNSFENYMKLVNEEKKNYKVKDSEMKKAVNCIKNFMKFNAKMLDNKDSKTLGVELDLTEDLEPDMQYNGIIDRVEQDKDGNVLIIDYKTGKPKTKVQLFSDPQLQGYAYLIHKKYGVPINKITCAHYYPVTNKLIDVRYSRGQIETWRRSKVAQIWQIRKLKQEDFTCRENQFCNWCGFRETLCPKFTDPTKARILLDEAIKKKEEEERNSELKDTHKKP